MKISYFVILVLIFTQVNSLFGQDIEYRYDDAGNRVQRKVIVLKSANIINNQDSTGSIGTNNNVSKNNADANQKDFFTDRLEENNIKIYPNPTKGQIKVVLANIDNCDNSSIELYSLSGKIIYKKNKISITNNIDLSDKPQGAYILRLMINNKKLEWKIIKE